MPILLSIDIGVKNLGWSLIEYEKGCEDSDLFIDFGIFVIDEKKSTRTSTVVSRCKRVCEFFDDFQPDYVVIERQVNTNTKAMELMYAVVMKAIEIVGIERVFIFDPKLKFTYYGEEYTTKGKQHKRKSIRKAHELLERHYGNLIWKFEEFDKKDDISDAINQGITLLKMKKMI